MLHADEQNRDDVKEARANWKSTTENIAPENIVFLDESSTKTNMTKIYGHAMGGQRCNDYAPHGKMEHNNYALFGSA